MVVNEGEALESNRPICHERYVLRGQAGALIYWKFSNNQIGIGDCFPWEKYGDLSLDKQLHLVYQGKFTEITENSYRWAKKQSEEFKDNSDWRRLKETSKHSHFLFQQADEISLEKLKRIKVEGYKTIKVKMGADFRRTVEVLNCEFAEVNQATSDFKIRLDWNAQGSFENLKLALAAMSTWVRSRIEFIEDPFPYNEIEWSMANDLIPIALDQEERQFNWDNKITFSVLVIKPSRQNVDFFLEKALRAKLKVVITSSLDHPYGLAFAIAEQERVRKIAGLNLLEGGCDSSYLSLDLLEKFEKGIQDSVWFESSGSARLPGDTTKNISLPNCGLEISAAAVNSHLRVNASDKWALVLPEIHVGGYGVRKRAQLMGNEVVAIPGKWQAAEFHRQLIQSEITLISMVPTQLYDLVNAGFQCPKTVRAILIGGAALSVQLYFQARELGWPVLPTYGLTEVGSSVAIANLDSLQQKAFPKLQILEHCQVKLSKEGKIQIRSLSLMNGFLQNEKWTYSIDEEGFFTTEDLGEIDQNYLRILGRDSDFIKILGRGVSLNFLNEIAMEVYGPACWIKAEADDRRGFNLVLLAESKIVDTSEEIFLKRFNDRVKASESLSELRIVDKLPRSPLGKVLRGQI